MAKRRPPQSLDARAHAGDGDGAQAEFLSDAHQALFKEILTGEVDAAPAETPHVIDHTIPESDWPGYWCDQDQRHHKDGTTIFFNLHCIACKTQLVNKFK